MHDLLRTSTCLLIKDWVVDNNIDILALTENWLQPDNKDDHIIGDLTPTGYSFYHSPRQTRGDGVGILIKDVSIFPVFFYSSWRHLGIVTAQTPHRGSH